MAPDGQKWPDWLWIVRHGQSESNVARKLAEEAAREHIGIEIRDVDVALSAHGREQALAVGRWFAGLAPDERPNLVLVAPYRRAVQTAQAICEAAGDRVLIVCHSVVVNCFRYLLERMTEEEIMEEDRVNEILNCSITSYRYDPGAGRRGTGGLVREQCNDVRPLIQAGVGIS